MTNGHIWVGMSGFSYPEWVGDVYPAGTKRDGLLAAYAQLFESVEINMTFRRNPQAATLDRWREAVPAGFRFAMKGHQRITHWKRLVDTGDDVAGFVRSAQRLGDQLGPLLFQTPPSVTFESSVLDDFFACLPPGPTYAFEPRHESFAGEAANEILRRYGVTRCVNDDVIDPGTSPATGPVAYLRLRSGPYDAGRLEKRAHLARELATSGIDVYVFFKHTADPESVRPALRFQELVA